MADAKPEYRVEALAKGLRVLSLFTEQRPTWRVTDEPYNFRHRPERVRVLATLDESTYSGGTMGADHPIAWTAAVGRGRSFYTGLGHPDEIYADPVFRRLLAAGIRYAAG